MYIISPHSLRSREVQETDLIRLKKEVPQMINLLNNPESGHLHGYALAHSQVCNADPLRFFVTETGVVVCNPRITRHTNQIISRKEGCLSFPYEPVIMVGRYNKCEVEYYEFIDGGLRGPIVSNFSGLDAEIFQHEISHMNGHYIYEDGACAEQVL